MKIKPIKLHTTNVVYPLDYRRKAYIQTNDKRFIEKACVDFEGKLVRTVDVYLKQDVDKYFVRKSDLMKEQISSEFIEKQKVINAINNIQPLEKYHQMNWS